MVNRTSESLRVACSAGFDGGLPQRFVAELYDATSGRLERNLSTHQPAFGVTRLPAGLELRVRLYAVNARGASRPTTLDGFTLKAAEKRVSSSSSAVSSSNSIGTGLNLRKKGVCYEPFLEVLVLLYFFHKYRHCL